MTPLEGRGTLLMKIRKSLAGVAAGSLALAGVAVVGGSARVRRRQRRPYTINGLDVSQAGGVGIVALRGGHHGDQAAPTSTVTVEHHRRQPERDGRFAGVAANAVPARRPDVGSMAARSAARRHRGDRGGPTSSVSTVGDRRSSALHVPGSPSRAQLVLRAAGGSTCRWPTSAVSSVSAAASDDASRLSTEVVGSTRLVLRPTRRNNPTRRAPTSHRRRQRLPVGRRSLRHTVTQRSALAAATGGTQRA